MVNVRNHPNVLFFIIANLKPIILGPLRLTYMHFVANFHITDNDFLRKENEPGRVNDVRNRGLTESQIGENSCFSSSCTSATVRLRLRKISRPSTRDFGELMQLSCNIEDGTRV